MCHDSIYGKDGRNRSGHCNLPVRNARIGVRERHPSVAGTYLAAATIYSAIYKKQAAESPAVSGIDADTAAFLRSVAWDTVQEYYGKKE
jgi:hypothetical protein